MKIGGFMPFTLCDFPGRVSAIVFTQGCNFRCPWCQNGSLIPVDVQPDKLVPEAEVLQFLQVRRGQLDGVVVSGGEPTLQADVLEFLCRIKAIGFEVKLDTNGSSRQVKEPVTDSVIERHLRGIQPAVEGQPPGSYGGRLGNVWSPPMRTANAERRGH